MICPGLMTIQAGGNFHLECMAAVFGEGTGICSGGYSISMVTMPAQRVYSETF